MNRTVLRWSTAGERWVRTAASASSVVSSSATGSWPGASKYGIPGRCCSTAAGQPRGVRVLMPRPLSSQTSSSGQSRRTCVRYAAALKAPAAVEWFTEASPKLAMTSASSGHGVSRPSTFASPRAKPSPTARGRCEAMVEVVGTMCSPAWPKTLCRPPEIGSDAEQVRLRSVSRTGSTLPSRCARAA